jgi:hypothetical protein
VGIFRKVISPDDRPTRLSRTFLETDRFQTIPGSHCFTYQFVEKYPIFPLNALSRNFHPTHFGAPEIDHPYPIKNDRRSNFGELLAILEINNNC